LAQAAWSDSPRYGQQYPTGLPSRGHPGSSCAPCSRTTDDHRGNGADAYRGNGADNLGYDWSPSAWGGPAFPNKPSENGRNMKDDWGRGEPCKPCANDRENPNKGWSDPPNYRDATQGSMVTSSVLSIRHPNDKRLPVEWSSNGRSMRMDGYRNGMSWDRADNREMGYTPSWENNGHRGNYASDWSYQYGSSNKWNERPSNPS